jgi:NurA-like 5'-3' nuclease
MGVAFNKKFKKYWNISKFLIIQKIKIKRPYIYKYTTTNKAFQKYTENFKMFKFKPTSLFLTKKNIFFGTSVLADYVIKSILKKKRIQKQIEEFFIETVGEPFIEWFKTATPLQKDFAF